MGEGGLWAPELAARALRQAEGDVDRGRPAAACRTVRRCPGSPTSAYCIDRRRPPAASHRARLPHAARSAAARAHSRLRRAAARPDAEDDGHASADARRDRAQPADSRTGRFADDTPVPTAGCTKLLRDAGPPCRPPPATVDDPEPYDITRRRVLPGAPAVGASGGDGSRRDRCAGQPLVPQHPRPRRLPPRGDSRRGASRPPAGRGQPPADRQPVTVGRGARHRGRGDRGPRRRRRGPAASTSATGCASGTTSARRSPWPTSTSPSSATAGARRSSSRSC